MRRSSTHEYERTHTTVQLRWFTTISLSSFFFFVSTRRRTKRNCRCRARRAVLCWIISLIQATEEETGRAAAAVFFLLLFSDVLERASPRLGVPLMRIDERILFSSLLSFVFLSCLHLFSWVSLHPFPSTMLLLAAAAADVSFLYYSPIRRRRRESSSGRKYPST